MISKFLEFQSLYQLPRYAFDALARNFRHRRTGFATHVANHDPKTGTVDVIFAAGADGAGELHQFQMAWIVIDQVQRRERRFSRLDAGNIGGRRHQLEQDSSRVVNQVAEALRHENRIDVARSRLLELVNVVIGQRRFERDLDRGVRLVIVWNQSYGHGGLVLHEIGHFG